MKAVVLTGIRQMAIRDIPEPTIQNESDVLLKIAQVGVCGSDVHYYETGRIGDQIIHYPFIVGHECSARVAAIGAAVTRVKVGDRVAVDPAVVCFQCDQCLNERENTCRELRFLGCPGQLAGCLCEFIVMPEASCFGLADTVSDAEGVLCEPLAIAIYAVKQAPVQPGMQVAVLGSGPVGLSCMVSALAARAAHCYMTDMIAERLAIAQTNGAAWTGNPERLDIVAAIQSQQPGGMDVVFECAGQQETVDQAIELLKPGGRLMLIGIPRLERISLDIHMARRKEISIVNVRRQNRCTQTAIDWITQRRVNARFMETHQYALSQTQQAFELVSGYKDGVIKAIIHL